MVSLEQPPQATSKCAVEPISSPRISFSADFLDENNFISICPNREGGERETAARNVEFEFLSGDLTNMITADELFCEGKLLPFWPVQHVEKLNKIALKKAEHAEEGPTESEQNNEERRISWFIDDDPSPRPPKCTVLWKELLRLRKQPASALSPSSSSSSSSSSASSSESSSADERKKGGGDKDKVVNRVKKGLERTRSASIRIRPMINVPICTAAKNTSLPPLFPLRRGRLES